MSVGFFPNLSQGNYTCLNIRWNNLRKTTATTVIGRSCFEFVPIAKFCAATLKKKPSLTIVTLNNRK